MYQVVARLDALDPDAGAAARVITQFDSLVEGRAGLGPILHAVALLCQCPVRLLLPDSGIRMRAQLDGTVDRIDTDFDSGWPTAALREGQTPAFWLERSTPIGLVDAMVLDRAAFAVRDTLTRTQTRSDDVALIETLLDPLATEAERVRAGKRLRMPAEADVRAVATAGREPRVVVAAEILGGAWMTPGRRTGLGRAVKLLDLPGSWTQARTALRFACEDTDDDPGPRVVFAEEIESLAVLADAVDPATPPHDVRALESVAKTAPWVLRSLVEFTEHGSLRSASAALFVHHSTLTERLTIIERQLGWSVRDSPGRFRTQLALAIRRVLLHPDPPHGG